MDIITTLTGFETTMILLGYLFTVSVVALFYVILSFSTPIARHHKTTIILTSFTLYVITICIGIMTVDKLLKVPKVTGTTPHTFDILDTRHPEITITFETPIHTETLRINTFPETELIITPRGYFGNRIPYARTITVSPKTTFPAGEQIMVYFSNIEGPFTRGYGGEYLLKLIASELPVIETISSPTTMSDVPIHATFTATLNAPIHPSGRFHVTTFPESKMSVKTINDTTLAFIPEEPLKQGTAYRLYVYQTPLLYRYSDGKILKEDTVRLEKTIEFKTISPPYINLFEPLGSGVNPTTDIKILFDQKMNTDKIEQRLTISPAIPLSYSWENDGQTAIIRHKSFSFETTYRVTIPKGIMTKNGGILESDVSFEFTTFGPVKLLRSSPTHDATDISIQTPISISFDQEINSDSIESNISISPLTAGKITTDATIVTFTPDKPFANNTRYLVQVASGLKSIHGLPSTEIQSFSFTTAPVQVVLPVPYFPQQSDFTCNIASARMLLAYRGVITDEKTLISAIGKSENRGIGNPNKGYVPDYGTYWDALIRGVIPYRPYHLITNGKLSDIIRELKQGNPVMTWGQNGWSDPHDISWSAKDGTYIRAINGMHSAVVRGFKGPEANPTHIILNDPWRGQYSITTDEFLRRWGYFNVALVVE